MLGARNMAAPVESILVVLSIAAAVVAFRRRPKATLFPALSRLSGTHVPSFIACPKSGRRVQCTLVYQERTGECLGIDACAAMGDPASPQCDQDCVKLLNLGISLRPPDVTPTADDQSSRT